MAVFLFFVLVIAVDVGVGRLSKAKWLGVGKVCD